MKIRIKIKHLVLTVTALALFVPIFLFLIQPQLTIYMAERQMAKGEPAGKERILDLLDNRNIFSEQRFSLIREYMINDSTSLDYDVYVGTTSTYWSDVDQAKIKFSMEERLPYLLEYIETGPIDGYMESAAGEVANHYHFEGDWIKGDKVLQVALDRGNSTYFRSDLATKQIELAVRNGEYERALSYIEKFYKIVSEDDIYTNAVAVNAHAEILLINGEYEKALAIVEEALSDLYTEHEENHDIESRDNEQSTVEKQLKDIKDRIKDGEYTFNTVSGKVFKNEREKSPFEEIGVFLREKNALHYSISVGPGEHYQAVTDKNGEYKFHNVPPGSYQLFFGFTFDQIDGYALSIPSNPWIEVEDGDVVAYDSVINPLIEIYHPVNSEDIMEDDIQFSWEPVEGAAYYSISVGREIEGGSISYHLKSGIKTPEFSVTKEELHYSQGGIQFTEESDWEEIDYNSVLGFADPSGRFFWNVQAHNEDGDLLTQSQGYRLGEDTFGNLPMFYLKNRELTEADKVLLKNKPEEALGIYKESFEKNPDDLHSLLMISKIIGVESDVHNNSSKDLAIPYLEELARKAPSEAIFSDILEYHYEKKDWHSYDMWYGEYQKIKGDILDEYIEGMRAIALMKQGKYTEARTQFQRVMEQGYRHEQIGEWIALEILLGTPLERVEALGKKYPEQGIFDTRIDWERLVGNIIHEQVEYDDYNVELKKVMEWLVKEENDQLESWKTSTDKVELKRFVDELRK